MIARLVRWWNKKLCRWQNKHDERRAGRERLSGRMRMVCRRCGNERLAQLKKGRKEK